MIYSNRWTLGEMAAEFDIQAERAELEAVLKSDAFARSPMVAQMLKYICELHFKGLAHEIKEYNIAVEAFGRPANFDQSRDSIVRVEAHRLRKRLQDYYAQQGAGHQIRIILPPGNYVPQFVRRAETVEPAAEVEEAPVVPKAAEAPAEAMVAIRVAPVPAIPGGPLGPEAESAALPKQRGPRRLVGFGIAALCAAVLVAAFFWTRSAREAPVASGAPGKVVAATAPVAAMGGEVRILAGSGTASVVDHYGNTWSGDRYFQGGVARAVSPRPIVNSQDPEIYLHRRQGNFAYHIPLPKGVYEMRLYFAETVFGENNVAGGGETTRVFQMRANGVDLLQLLDVIADAGGSNTADIKVFKNIQPASDGMLHLEFQTWNNEVPFVNGIEIEPSRPGAIRPIRFLARDSGYTDHNGRYWGSDRYFHNGIEVQRHDPVGNTEDEPLYQNERFGNFTYTIPVALGSRYTVTMKFCESWFGPERPAGGGVGKRVFDVSLNGRILLSNFDVFKEGGRLKALDKTFKGVEPNAQGKLVLTFAPVRNYAMVNAIEVVDEAWK